MFIGQNVRKVSILVSFFPLIFPSFFFFFKESIIPIGCNFVNFMQQRFKDDSRNLQRLRKFEDGFRLFEFRIFEFQIFRKSFNFVNREITKFLKFKKSICWEEIERRKIQNNKVLNEIRLNKLNILQLGKKLIALRMDLYKLLSVNCSINKLKSCFVQFQSGHYERKSSRLCSSNEARHEIP